MIHGLSPYNYDFAVAAIPLQILLMLFYCARRNLPVRRHRFFLVVMVANLIMTVFDLVSCEMNEVWQDFPLWVMYLVNLLYFAPFIIRGWALAGYTAEVCEYSRFFQHHIQAGRIVRLVVSIPSAVTLGLIFLSPWTGAIFTFGPEGYANNYAIYPIIYYTTYFNIGVSILFVLLRWRALPLQTSITALGFNLILLIGIIFRKMFFHVLVTSYVSILTILVIYLSSQNPDFFRDRITKLFNRSAFEQIGLDFLRKNKPFSCILVTANNYETARSIYGFHQVNKSLALVGSWLIKSFPRYYVFYFENGNFLLLRSGEIGEQQETILGELAARFAHPWIDEGTEVSFSISTMILPYTSMPHDITAIHNLLRYSFSHSHAENQRGNNTITERMLSAFKRQKAVEAALDKALGEHRIMAYYQPIYSTFEKRVVGAEALARLIDPQIGNIPPDEFIHVSERTGEIMELGRQIFEAVCSFIQSASLRERGIEFVNVNLSPAQCMNEQLAVEFSEIAERHHIPMGMIDFEITESTAEDGQTMLNQAIRLQKSGAELSIDDFGTGTSNLTRLMKLPIHVVKVDMSVVQAYFNGETHILPDLIRMFKNAGLKVVVEGVETKEMKDALCNMGCDYLQGYYFSRPIPPEQFEKYLENANELL